MFLSYFIHLITILRFLKNMFYFFDLTLQCFSSGALFLFYMMLKNQLKPYGDVHVFQKSL